MVRRILVAILAGGLVLAFPFLAPAQPANATQTTQSYQLTLTIGPAETMLTPAQAKGATTGEVMQQVSGMPMSDPTMAMTDQGQPVNHHLEVQVADKTTGKILDTPVPTISVQQQPSGQPRQLPSVTGMYGVTAGPADFHFGSNVYLPNGTYTVTVQLGTEKATFQGVAVGASAPSAAPIVAPSAAPIAAASAPAALPRSGEPRAEGLVLGLIVLAGGLALRGVTSARRSRRDV